MKWNLNEKLKENLRQLYRQFKDDDMKFYKYFKMSIQQFTILVSKVEFDLTQEDTTFKQVSTKPKNLSLLGELRNLFYSKNKITFLVIIIKREQKVFEKKNLLFLKIASIHLISSKFEIITFTDPNL